MMVKEVADVGLFEVWLVGVCRIQRVESSNKALEGQVASLKQKVQEAESVNVMLKDEQLANQVSSTKLEEKFKALTKDYDVMVSRSFTFPGALQLLVHSSSSFSF